MKAYELTTHDGKTVDWLTKAALLECEKRLGYPLTIVQGSYHKGVGASAGTHDGGGAVDLAPWDWENKVRVLRAVGFAAWHRPTLPGVWGEHIHAVLIGNRKLAPSAARQVTAYRNGRDGLARNLPDNTWRPKPIPTFSWAKFQRAQAAAFKAAKKAAEARTVDTVVTFANIPSTATRDQIQRGFDVASKGSDVLITVEDHMRRSADFLGPEWLTFQGPGHQKGRCSVHLLADRFDVRGSSNPLLNRANGMTFPGATRYGQVVRSQDKRSGRLFNWGGFHLVPHADKDSQPGVLTDMPRGKANVLPAIASMILALPASLVGQEVWGADVNVDLDEDLRIRDLGMVEKFNAAGFVSDVQVLGPVPDTHGRDEYDWLMGRLSTPAVRWVAHETLPKLPGLDHRFRRGTIRSTVRKGFPG